MSDSFPSPFRFCPNCGNPGGEFVRTHEFRCPRCRFRYFHNVAAAAGVVLRREGRYLFLVRAIEPAQGKLGLPGGFVDPGERVEDTLVREVREEIGGEIENARFLASFPNRYGFKETWYNTCDLYFTADLVTDPNELKADPAEVSGLRWIHPGEIEVEDLAFGSLKRLWNEVVRIL